MAILKIGKEFINGNPRDVYLLQGRAIRDGEIAPVNGKDHSRVCVAAMEKEDGTTMFVTVNGWRDRTPDIAAVRKNGSVLAVGTMSSREYNGKTYWDMDANFLVTSGNGAAAVRGVNVEPADFEPFAAIEEEDAQLPF